MRLGGFRFSSSPATFQLHPSFVAYVARMLEFLGTEFEAWYIRSLINYCERGARGGRGMRAAPVRRERGPPEGVRRQGGAGGEGGAARSHAAAYPAAQGSRGKARPTRAPECLPLSPTQTALTM